MKFSMLSPLGAVGSPVKSRVLGKAIIIKITFPEHSASFEDKSVKQHRNLNDTRKNPGKQIVTFNNIPRNTRGMM